MVDGKDIDRIEGFTGHSSLVHHPHGNSECILQYPKEAVGMKQMLSPSFFTGISRLCHWDISLVIRDITLEPLIQYSPFSLI
jgi:hypothetical protein